MDVIQMDVMSNRSLYYLNIKNYIEKNINMAIFQKENLGPFL